MNHVKDAFPSGKSGELGWKFSVVSESIIRGLLHIRSGGAVEREVDDQRARHQVRVIGGPPPVDADRDASERVVPMWDSWADNLKKSLSQTEIGRMFEGTSESEAVSSEQRPVGAQRLTRNRMAG